MRKSYIKGSRILMIFTMLIVVFNMGLIGTTIDSYRDFKTLYSEGTYSLKSGGYAVIKITGIEKTDIKDESLKSYENFYLVQHEQGVVMLKATDEQLEKMTGFSLRDIKFREFRNEEIYARVETIPEEDTSIIRDKEIKISPNLKKAFTEEANKSVLMTLRELDVADELGKNDREALKEKMNENPFRDNIYIIPTSSWYHINNAVVLLIVTLITLLTVRKLVKNIILVRNNYERLFLEHPEVEKDFDLLRNEAEYIDEALKIIVYKGALIFYHGKFTFINVSEIAKIEIGVYYEENNENSKKYYFDIIRNKGNSLFLDLPKKYFKNIRITSERLNRLGEFLKEKYKMKIFYKY